MTGVGKVFKGKEFIKDVRYDHRIIQHYDKGATLGGGPYKVPTVASVYLRITPSIGVSADLLTLHMSDGKKQDFYATSSNGDCQATSGPY
jgi:hypothetical protein